MIGLNQTIYYMGLRIGLIKQWVKSKYSNYLIFILDLKLLQAMVIAVFYLIIYN